MKRYKLFWAPEGKQIAEVMATDPRSAIRKAPMPYVKYLGEIYTEEIKERCDHKFIGSTRCVKCGWDSGFQGGAIGGA